MLDLQKNAKMVRRIPMYPAPKFCYLSVLHLLSLIILTKVHTLFRFPGTASVNDRVSTKFIYFTSITFSVHASLFFTNSFCTVEHFEAFRMNPLPINS